MYNNKTTIVILIAFISFWICKNLPSNQPKDEIIINNIHIYKKPCISVMNEIFSSGVDSVKACDCLIPAFYEFVKDDSFHLAKFKEIGVHTLDKPDNDKFMIVYAECVEKNIIDSNAKIKMTGIVEEKFQEALARGLDSVGVEEKNKRDIMTKRLMEKFNTLTIMDYLHLERITDTAFQKMLAECVVDTIK